MTPPWDRVHEVEVSDDPDRVLTCPKCPYKAVIEGQSRVLLTPGDPHTAHIGSW